MRRTCFFRASYFWLQPRGMGVCLYTFCSSADFPHRADEEKMSMKKCFVLAVAAGLSSYYTQPAHADSATWVPAGGGSWATDTNWSAPHPNGVDQVATFDTPTAARTVSVDSGATGFTIGTLNSTNNGNPAVSQTIQAGSAGSNLIFDVTT